NAQLDAGLARDAVDSFAAARRLAPGDSDIAFSLADALSQAGDRDRALQAYEAVIALDPGHARAHAYLASLLIDKTRMTEAVALLDRAAALDPSLAHAHVNLSCARMMTGDSAGAIAAARKALDLDPALADAHSNLIQMMSYADGVSPADLLAETRVWNERHARPLLSRRRPHANPRQADRRLRVGFIGGDFRNHPVGWFSLPFLAEYDRDRIESFVYMTNAIVDPVSEKIRPLTDRWRDVPLLDPDQLAEAIRADGIDILVDVAGHTAHNRLLAMALRPAPVQAVGFGLVGTTGVDGIDYILADRFEIPPDHEKFYSEAVVRLPDDYICYAFPDYMPAAAEPPARQNGFVTFGCFNTVAKVTPGAVFLWSRLLKAVPDARLLLKTYGFNDASCRDRIAALFAEQGIGAGRLTLEGSAPHAELLSAYGRVDIALDPLAYSGGLTTLESLAMGVPVVTLPGRTFAARHSATHLSNAGLTEWIAKDADGYIAIARKMAGDPDALAALRAGLRTRLAGTPVCDGRRYARALEAAFRAMWRIWCAGEKPRHLDIPPP
ncbi:MAG: tetratricopeptide repeat protein, partial [Alphaproteobacteria bacterium]|nr:tetratricopeptide repeat protein [Alphaproteobacteria bacterium]